MNAKPSILVIDDEAIVCESCSRILAGENYKVDTNTDPKEGFQQAIKNNYDLILLDLMMDSLDGMEILNRIRKIKPDIPVIIITGYPSKESKEESKSLGVLFYILKPFTPKEIIQPIKSLLEHENVNEVKFEDIDTAVLPELPVKEKIKIVKDISRKPTGIYFIDSYKENDNSIDSIKVSDYIKKIPEVKEIWNLEDFPLLNIDLATKKITASNIERLVIAGDTPGEAFNFFTKAMLKAGKDPNEVILAGFRDYGVIYKSQIEIAKAILLCSIYNIPYHTAVVPDENPVNTTTLVVGGGIAGIQASLELANSGNKVYLVEKTGTIGGHMATFDKTFPTLDCAACILTPKMVEVGQHPNIELMTYCEVKGMSGEPGNYKVRILKKARRVNINTCSGCGTCASKCPSTVPSEFDAGTTMRKAIYIPFPQAVPNKYLIDADHCRYVQEGKCGVCAKSCPVVDCINLDEEDKDIEITVGNIILATGFKPFDAKRIDDYGYGKYPNVLTSLEFERLVNASGPTGGNIRFRTKDKKGNWIFNNDSGEPESVALIHCVGSRDIHYNQYCSRVCCMYSLKLAHLVKEKLPNAKVFEYYIDMRAFGKGYEEFYNRIKNEGIKIIRGRTAKIEEDGNQLVLRSEDIMNDTLIEQKVDMVVLAVGLEPAEDTEKLSQIFSIQTTEEGWFLEANNVFDSVNTCKEGITIAGVCQGPKDIPDTVAQASAAASRVIQSIMKGKINRSTENIPLELIERNVYKLLNA